MTVGVLKAWKWLGGGDSAPALSDEERERGESITGRQEGQAWQDRDSAGGDAKAKTDGGSKKRSREGRNKGDSEDSALAPRAAFIIIFIICTCLCFLGEIDILSIAISIMFLLMYGAINAGCFVLAVLNPPDWRPRFQYFHWSTALIGLLVCWVRYVPSLFFILYFFKDRS